MVCNSKGFTQQNKYFDVQVMIATSYSLRQGCAAFFGGGSISDFLNIISEPVKTFSFFGDQHSQSSMKILSYRSSKQKWPTHVKLEKVGINITLQMLTPKTKIFSTTSDKSKFFTIASAILSVGYRLPTLAYATKHPHLLGKPCK